MADKQQAKAPTPEAQTEATQGAIALALRLHTHKPEGPPLLSLETKDGGVNFGSIGQRSFITSVPDAKRQSYTPGFEATIKMWLDKPLGGVYAEWVEKGRVNWLVIPFQHLKQYKPDLA